MKKIVYILSVCFLLQLPAAAQSKQKAEKEFLKQLNSIVKNSKEQHWDYEGTMTIDSAFAINTDGILSVTVRYTNDSSFIRARMTGPINKIEGVAYDLYLILEYKEDLVTMYRSEPGSNELLERGKTHLFHIGAPLPEDIRYKEKLQKSLDKLLKYYPGAGRRPEQ